MDIRITTGAHDETEAVIVDGRDISDVISETALDDIIAEVNRALRPKFVAGGVYVDQDGTIYVGSQEDAYGEVYLWRATPATEDDGPGARFAGPNYYRVVQGRKFKPVLTASGVPLVVKVSK